jgi:carboxypeptidase family protein
VWQNSGVAMRIEVVKEIVGRSTFIGVVLILLRAAALSAQATTGSIEGRIDVAVGHSRAQVDVRDRSSGAVRQATTDARGRYRVLALVPGLYDITARALGYAPQIRTSIAVTLGERTTLDLTLEREPTQLAPKVIIATGHADLSRSDVATAVTPDQIASLPLNSRNVLDVAIVAPGVRSYATEGGRAVPAAGALSTPRFINFYLDGVEWKGISTGNLVGMPQSGSLVPQDAIREFRVLLNPYDAELTRGGSWVIAAVTYRGSNELHGSIFDFGQNRALIAKSTFDQTKPDYHRQQVGGTLRGPLIRDRLFFATSYEAQNTDNFIDVVPGRPPVNPGLWDEYAGTFRAPTRNRMGTIRLTAPLGRHSLDATWVARALSTETAYGIRVNGVMFGHDAGIIGRYRTSSIAFRDTYARGSLVNELTANVLTNAQDESPLAPGSTLRYPSLQRGVAAYPVLVWERHVGLSNKSSYAFEATGGQHLLKLGIGLTSIHGVGFQPSNADGFFIFPTDTSTLPQTARIGMGYDDPSSLSDARSSGHRWVSSAWFQDEFRPRESLALTVGVRYDAEVGGLDQGKHEPWATDTTLRRVVGDYYLNDGDRKNDLNNLAPRVAATWDIGGRGRAFLRAGYGVMYERIPAFGSFSERLGWQWRIYSFTTPGTTDPAELRTRVLSGGVNSAPNLVLLPDRLETPSSRQWSFGFGRRLSAHSSINLDYIDQHLRDMYVTVRVNGADPVTRQRPLTNRFGDLLLWGNFGDAMYRGLLSAFVFERGATKLTAAYTLSWASSEFGQVMNSDYPDSAAYSMQRSEADERHRLVLSGATRIPLAVQLSGILVVASPRPFLVIAGTDANLNGTPIDDWPNGRRTDYRGGWENWYRTLDIRLAKSIDVTRGAFLVTVEIFNALNSRNHSEYQGTESLAQYREPIGDYARREAQLGVRYSF